MIFSKLSKKNLVRFFILGLFITSIAAFMSYWGYSEVSPKEIHKRLQSDFLEKEAAFDNLFSKLTFDPRIKTTVDLITFCENNKVDSKNFIFFIYQDSTLNAWSSNEISPPEDIAKTDTSNFQYVNNKWVYIKRIHYYTNKYIGYIVVNDEAKNTNVVNAADMEFFPIHAASSFAGIDSNYIIKNNAGESVFCFSPQKRLKLSDEHVFLESSLWLIGLSFLIFVLIKFLFLFPFFEKDGNRLFLVIIPLLILSTKIFLSLLNFPTDLYSSAYYSSRYGSLGTLFVYSYCVLFLSTFFIQYFNTKHLRLSSKKLKIAIAVFLAVLTFSFHTFAYYVIRIVANDSFVVLGPELIYQYNILSIIVMLSIVFILLALFIFTYKSFQELLLLLEDRKLFLFTIAGSFIPVTALTLVYLFRIHSKSDAFFSYFFFILLIVLILFFILRGKRINNLLFQCFVYLISSCIVLFSVKQTVEEREEKYKESISNRMLSIQDPYVFYSFSELAQEIGADTNVLHLFDKEHFNGDDIERYIISTYLGKYTEDYHINIETGLLSSAQDNLRFKQLSFDNYATDRILSEDTVSFRGIDFGRSEYTLNLTFPIRNHEDIGRVFIVFRLNILSEEQSYMEESLQKEMANYSYAGYEDNALKMSVSNLGIPYMYRLSDYDLDTLYSGVKFTREGVEHTVFIHNNMVLLVSANKGVIWGKLSFVIILFFIQLLFSLVPASLFLFFGSQKKLKPGFQESIQLYITTLSAITVIITAILFSRFFINLRNYDKLETLNQMANKAREVITKSIEEISLTDITSGTIQYSSSELNSFFDVDFLNLNIYNKNGRLVKSYGRGICINAPINPLAFKQFSMDKLVAITVDEQFGKEKYKSLYRTIANQTGEVIGYLNLLSFTEKYEGTLDPRHSQFLARFMLVCLVTILLIVFFSMLLVRQLTRPLVKVTEQLSNISLKGNLPKIEWNQDDEFGKLVETYNFLTGKLQASAEMLERTSQEMAWKDMAKQIAHEIKNPLTPVRLTTQQIMRRLNSKGVAKSELENYFEMILEQTDTLNEIASSFANFAQTSQKEGSYQNLFSVIKNAVSSYNEEDVEILLENKTEQEVALSYVNRSQMMQVLNNLIKNAVQAKKPSAKQYISIVLQNYGDKMWQIKISDTGVGMTAEVKEKIFQPNFTTKTSGMGLGLAMVKQIILSWHGSIDFESTFGEGTVFSITLPKSDCKG